VNNRFAIDLLFQEQNNEWRVFLLEQLLQAGGGKELNRNLLLYAGLAKKCGEVLRVLPKMLSCEVLEQLPALTTLASFLGYQGVIRSAGPCLWRLHLEELASYFISKSGFDVTSREFHAALLLHVATFGMTSDRRLIDFSLRLAQTRKISELEDSDRNTIQQLVEHKILRREQGSLSKITTRTLMRDISASLDQLTFLVFTNPRCYFSLMTHNSVIEAMFLSNTTPYHPSFAFRSCDSGYTNLKKNYAKDLASFRDKGEADIGGLGEITFQVPGQRENRYLFGFLTNDFPQRLSPHVLGLCFAAEQEVLPERILLTKEFEHGLRSKIFFVPLFEKLRDERFPPKLVAGFYLIDCRTAEGESALLVRALNPVNYNVFRSYNPAGFVSGLFKQIKSVALKLGYESVWTTTGDAFSNRDALMFAMYQYVCSQETRITGDLEISRDTELNGYQLWNSAGDNPSLLIWRRSSTTSRDMNY
jgi:hypothetical protein